MDKKLREILGRLNAARDAGGLADDDWAVIERALGHKGAQAADAPQPLWSFLREQAIRWKTLFELPIDWVGQETDVVLFDAGVPTTARLDNIAARKHARVTRDGLVKSVGKHLAHDQQGVRSFAALLVGMARLDECVPAMIEAITTGREERNAWGAAQVLAPMFESLAMLEHPRARELAARFIQNSDDRLRRAAQVCTLIDSGSVDAAELARLMDAGIHNNVLIAFPDELVRMAGAGFALETRLQTLEYNTWRAADCLTLATMARKAKLEDYHRHLLAVGNYDLRLATFLDLIGSGATWALEAAKTQLASESDDQGAALLVAAISTLLPDDAARRTFLAEKLDGSRGEKMGAGWAAMAVQGLTAELEANRADSDDEIRRAANTALLVTSPDCTSELLEIRWIELSRTWMQWLPRLASKMLVVAGRPLPWIARDGQLLTDEQPPWRKAWLDEAVAFYGEAPARLIRRLSPEVTSSESVRVRAVHLAGRIGGPAMAAALETRLAACDSFSEGVELVIEASCAGGPSTSIGTVAEKLLIHEATHPVTLDDDDLGAAVVLALRNDSMIRSRAAAAMGQLGHRAEPYLAILAQQGSDSTLGKAVGGALAQLAGASNPYVANLAELMSGRAKQLSELRLLEVVACSGSAAVRAKVAETAGHDGNAWDAVQPWLVMLTGDQVDEVAIAALTTLARRAGNQGWVQTLLLEKSRSENWQVARQSVDLMGTSGSAAFVARLHEVLAKALTDNNQDLASRCVTALERIADGNPDRGLVVLDVREPHVVNTRYGMREDIDWNQDRRAEALRLVMVALDRRKDTGAATSHKGKTVLFSKAQASMGATRSLSRTEFDGLALYFRVTFSDADSGAIVAEVGDEPTGELLNALLQTDAVCVTHASWS